MREDLSTESVCIDIELKLMLFREMSRYGTERFNPSRNDAGRRETVEDEAEEAAEDARRACARWIDLWRRCPRVAVVQTGGDEAASQTQRGGDNGDGHEKSAGICEGGGPPAVAQDGGAASMDQQQQQAPVEQTLPPAVEVQPEVSLRDGTYEALFARTFLHRRPFPPLCVA